jgi:CRISPR-associated protein Cmr2
MTMTTGYWQHKLSLWLHDPVHKVFDIRRHESLAAEIADLLHVSVPAKTDYQYADMLASGMTRAALPGYSGGSSRSGAIDFAKSPTITHPLVKDCHHDLATGEVHVNRLHRELKSLLTEDIGLDQEVDELCSIPSEQRPLNGFYNRQDSPEQWARALYFYLFFALKKRVRHKNVGGLGSAWDLLPADSRIPDHPLWHHLGLTSAIGSALREGDSVSLAVFAITPVQPFISKARKLRDHWAGSVVLSYLSFAGLRHIAENLGPDHVVYPSLQDQALVEAWLGKTYHLDRFLTEPDPGLARQRKEAASIASFPNKFVFLCPTRQTAELCRQVENSVNTEWLRVAGLVRDFLGQKLDAGPAMASLFDHQISDYWQYSHAAARLATLNDRDSLDQLLSPVDWQHEGETLAGFAAPYGQTGAATARLYGASHSLIQKVLAAGKHRPTKIRKPQHGEKCPLCGEHEVLHDFAESGTTAASIYKSAVDTFWQRARSRFNPEGSHSQVGKNERICGLCAVKRFLPQALKETKDSDELLKGIFGQSERFPATTEVAAAWYLREVLGEEGLYTSQYRSLVDHLHQAELDIDGEDTAALDEIREKGEKRGITYTDRDKYYAVLLMDGDKMGDLINGQSLEARWSDAIHPELRERFSDINFNLDSPLESRLTQKRLINPALHAAISESLNSFARYGVAPIINTLGGRLIYAGGDDVCAILPLQAALEAATRIQQSYRQGFIYYSTDGAKDVNTGQAASAPKIGMHLETVRVSPYPVRLSFAHHKVPLRSVLRDAHEVLDEIAKTKAAATPWRSGSRNAPEGIAICGSSGMKRTTSTPATNLCNSLWLR